MNRGLKNELTCLLGLAGLLALPRRDRKLGLGLLAAAGALALYRSTQDSFTGQSAVITGGSRGLGLALALELVKEGALVAILARDAEELENAHRQILGTYPDARVLPIVCDITQPHEIETALQKTHRQFGGIDLLINNAGSITVGPYDQMVEEDFAAQLELHLYAVMNAVNMARPYLIRGLGRRIVNICSMGGKVAVPHMLPYDVSKFALSGYSQGLNAELAAEGISVTTVYPALMRTGSAIQAVFKGDHQKEYAWFQSADVFPLLSASAEDIAAKVIESARHRDAELVPSIPGRIRNVGAAIFPELAAAALRLVARLMPKNVGSGEYKTGAASNHLFENSVWSLPLRGAERKVEEELNQKAKFDAEFNMGLKKNMH
jgi:short-subunit dehydrogenase